MSRTARPPPTSQLSLFEATRRLLTGAMAEHVIDLRGTPVRYVLRRAKRRTIGFTVGPHGLRVSAPRWTGLPEIEVALQVKSSWILDKLADQDQRRVRRDASKIEWKTGALLPFFGQPLVLVVHDDAAVEAPAKAGRGAMARVWLEDGPFDTADAADAANAGSAADADDTVDASNDTAVTHVATSADVHDAPDACTAHAARGAPRLHVVAGAAPHAVRDAVLAWLKQQALAIFVPRCEHFAERLGVRYAAVRLSSAQTRWGSASSVGVIRLSWRLVHFPPDTIDYVVAHELAHLREMNHSPRFWAVVESVVPDYRERRGTLQSDLLPIFD